MRYSVQGAPVFLFLHPCKLLRMKKDTKFFVFENDMKECYCCEFGCDANGNEKVQNIFVFEIDAEKCFLLCKFCFDANWNKVLQHNERGLMQKNYKKGKKSMPKNRKANTNTFILHADVLLLYISIIYGDEVSK